MKAAASADPASGLTDHRPDHPDHQEVRLVGYPASNLTSVAATSRNQPESASGHEDWLVGRHHELSQLQRALQAAGRGRPRLVAVEGAPGVGKTALVRRFLAQSGEVGVLGVRGEELESSLRYGVLERLAAGVRELLPEWTDLDGISAGDSRDPFVVGGVLLDLFGVVQQAGPIVVVVDDAQWSDTPSLEALAFAFRRLRIDRVLGIVVARDLADTRIPGGLRRALSDEHGNHLRLAGLTIPELRELASRLGISALTNRAVTRLHDHTKGSPLYTRALLEEVPAEILCEGFRPLPAPRSFAHLVLERVARWPTPVADLVEAAAVLGGECRFELAAQLANVPEPLAALEQAIDARLVEERFGGPGLTIGFCHPLIRAAVYQALGPARRASLHRTAAALINEDAVALQHRVLAATGTDPQLANDIAKTARRHIAVGAWSSAADALTTASRLLGSGFERDRLILEAVECMLLAGDVTRAISYAGPITMVGNTGWREYILGRLAIVTGRLEEAHARLSAAWRTCQPTGDPVLGARIAGMLAYHCILRGRGLDGARWADRALHLDPEGTATDMIRYLQLVGRAIAGWPEDALARVAGLPDPRWASIAELDALLGRGLVRTWTDDLAGAYHDLAGLVTAARDRSAPFRVLALAALSQVEYRLGRWDDGLVHAQLAVSLADDTDQQWVAVYGHAMAALIQAARGNWQSAESHVSAGWAAVGGPQYPAQFAYAALAEAQLRTAQRDPVGVIRALRPMLDLEGQDGLNEPGVVPWHDLLTDALTSIGHHQEASALLDRWQALAAARGRRSAQVAAARARGRLEAARGNHKAAEQMFQAGLEHAGQIDEPFICGLLEAAYGEFLRRTSRRSAAAAHLRAAGEIFAQLQARPYLERCDRELLGCGLTPRRRQDGGIHLTPQELAVARLAARGLTNRQAAADLVVSVKTVEYHLAKVYTKLAITSRSQLGSQLDNLRDGTGEDRPTTRV
jgi:ATP/maltotriose-dependent transcriptional regulator MalT